MSKLHCISRPNGARADVIFIHGLGGDAFFTWQHDRKQPKDSWLFWLKNRMPDIAIHTLEYQASPTHWLGEAMPLQDRAVEVLAEFDLCSIGNRPVMFVGHSLGGLVIKQLLHIANEEQEGTAANNILQQTRLVAFFATPHMGADAATWGSHLGKVLRASPALLSLKAHDAHLRTLDHWYRSQHESWTTLAFIETKPTNVSSFIPMSWFKRLIARLPTRILVVAQGDANPNIPNVRAIPMEDDHISITKPTDPESKKCLLVERAIRDEISPTSKTPTPNFLLGGSENRAEEPAPALAAAPAPPIVPSSRTRLHALPPQNPDFVGREEDMAKIKAALAKGGAVITAIEGMGGIGKTAVGIEVANALRDEGLIPGGVPFVDLEGFSATHEPLSTREALEVLIRPMVGPEAKLPDGDLSLQQLWKQTTAHREQMLLFLDNARDEAQIRPLLPGHPSCNVLATSRHRLNLDGITPIRLDVMEPDEATDLAYTLANRWQEGRVSREQAGELARLCGYLPLPIKVTAASLGKGKLLDVDTELRKLAEVSQNALGMDEVKAILGQSLDQLSPDLQAAWQKLGVFEGDFSTAAAVAVLDNEDAEAKLAELEQSHLVILSKNQRLQLHDIVRALALEYLPFDRREIAVTLHAKYYKDVLSNANRLYLDGHAIEGFKLYDLEQHQIHAGWNWILEKVRESDDYNLLAAQYPDGGATILFRRLAPNELITWFMIQADACRKIGERRSEGQALGNLGVVYKDIGETERAIELFESHVSIAREVNNREDECSALGNLGIAYKILGDAERALDFYREQLSIARSIGSRRNEGNALANMGIIHEELGDRACATSLLEESLETMREIGDKCGEAGLLNNIGNLQMKDQNYRNAIDSFSHSIRIADQISEHSAKGVALLNGAIAFEKLGERKRAIDWIREAIIFLKSTNNAKLAEARVMLSIWTNQAYVDPAVKLV